MLFFSGSGEPPPTPANTPPNCALLFQISMRHAKGAMNDDSTPIFHTSHYLISISDDKKISYRTRCTVYKFQIITCKEINEVHYNIK